MNLTKSSRLNPIKSVVDRFQKNNSNRSFVKGWLIQFSWLEYSISSDRAFGHTCRIFAKRSGNTESSFISSGYNNWTHAIARLKQHQISDCNQSAAILFQSRVQQDLKETSINQEMESLRAIQVKKNRKHLHAIIKIDSFTRASK